MLLSHVSQPTKIVTFQLLLSTQILEDADTSLRYQSHCSDILNALGDKFKFGSLEDLMATVASAMVDMAEILLKCKIVSCLYCIITGNLSVIQLSSLQYLMDLLRSIVVYLPIFSTSLFMAHQSEADTPPKFVDVICTLFKASFDDSNEGSGACNRTTWESLTRMTLQLLSAMAWVSPEDQALK